MCPVTRSRHSVDFSHNATDTFCRIDCFDGLCFQVLHTATVHSLCACRILKSLPPHSRISVVTMSGAAIAIDDAAAADTVLSVKQRVCAANAALPVHRQRLVFRAGPRGLAPLSNGMTLRKAGVEAAAAAAAAAADGAADGAAVVLDVVLADEMSADAVSALGFKVCRGLKHIFFSVPLRFWEKFRSRIINTWMCC
jgi:hypothetical protein